MSKVFSFLIPNKGCSSTLAKCIGSIKDQDYPEKEIIVVNDSPDESADNIIKLFPEVKRAVTGPEPMGAPYARNLAAKMATGDYFVFFDPDTVLMPGALRAWSEAFEEHPECGFVYSGYKITDVDGFYASEPFDPYFLEINNYINGMNPMRKEVFQEWDVKCRSLQDWDMWLRIVKSGVKGFYMGPRHYYYETAAPRKDGISADSHANWLERKEYIQKKLNLPVREICVTSLAAPDHARRIAKLLGIDYCGYEMLFMKPHKYKLVYLLGMFPGNGTRNFMPFYNSKTGTFKEGLKSVIHWIGTDIVHMRTMANFQQVRALADGYNRKFTQFCQSEVNQAELKEMGIKAELLTLPIDVPEVEPLALPDEFTVAIYDHGQSREDIYCKALMSDIIKSMPDVKFLIYGEEFAIGSERNYRFIGRVDSIESVIKQSSLMLRVTKHDGFPVGPVEFLVHNRPTVTNNNFKYQVKIDFDGSINERTVPIVKKQIIGKIRDMIAGEVKVDFESAKKYYRALLSPHKLKRRLRAIAGITGGTQ